MNTQAFETAYNASRNGTDNFYRHPLVRSFQYSDGVKECAEAGCYWLIDILATEVPKPLRASEAGMVVVKATVADSKAALKATAGDGDPPIWSRNIDYTDLPPGEYEFLVSDEGDRFALILISEY